MYLGQGGGADADDDSRPPAGLELAPRDSLQTGEERISLICSITADANSQLSSLPFTRG